MFREKGKNGIALPLVATVSGGGKLNELLFVGLSFGNTNPPLAEGLSPGNWIEVVLST